MSDYIEWVFLMLGLLIGGLVGYLIGFFDGARVALRIHKKAWEQFMDDMQRGHKE